MAVFAVTVCSVFTTLNSNPGMTAQDLADNLGITKRAVEKQTKKLRELQVPFAAS